MTRRILPFFVAWLWLAACEQPRSVAAPPPARETVSQMAGQPFYYYQNERILLRPDYSKFVVGRSPDVSSVAGVVHEALSPFGLTAKTSRQLGQVAGHDVYSLSGDLDGARNAIQALRHHPEITFAAPAYTLEDGVDTLLLVNELIVHFKDGVSQSAITDFVKELGAKVVRAPRPRYGFDEYRLAYPPASDPLAVAASIQSDPIVEWAEPNKIGGTYPALASPSDPYYHLQYFFKNVGTGVDINIEPVWDLTLGGGAPSAGGIRVAVIDDGVDGTHPDFGGQVMSNYAFDAINGDHYLAAHPECADDSHGTNVTGLILGVHDNGIGHAGAAPDVGLIPVRIYSQCDGLASDADVADAITWAWYWTQAHVISNSWYWPHVSTAITNAINQAVANGRNGKGATVVFAAGNVSQREMGIYRAMLYPGYLNSVIGVGAITSSGAAADYTPRDNRVDIVAPSGMYVHRPNIHCDTRGDVVTSELTGSLGCNDGPGSDLNYTSYFTGTSAAAPQVAAAAALIYSLNSSLTQSTVRGMLLGHADYWGRTDDFGAGKLNVHEAIRVRASIQGPDEVYSYKTCTWHANASGGMPPYTYTWYRDGTPVGNGPNYTGDTGPSDFYLFVLVTDYLNSTGYAGMNVTVIDDPWTLTCEV